MKNLFIILVIRIIQKLKNFYLTVGSSQCITNSTFYHISAHLIALNLITYNFNEIYYRTHRLSWCSREIDTYNYDVHRINVLCISILEIKYFRDKIFKYYTRDKSGWRRKNIRTHRKTSRWRQITH